MNHIDEHQARRRIRNALNHVNIENRGTVIEYDGKDADKPLFMLVTPDYAITAHNDGNYGIGENFKGLLGEEAFDNLQQHINEINSQFSHDEMFLNAYGSANDAIMNSYTDCRMIVQLDDSSEAIEKKLTELIVGFLLSRPVPSQR